MKIKVAGFDPGTANWGLAQCLVDTESLEVEVVNLLLNTTESAKLKGIAKASDDLRRAKEQFNFVMENIRGHALVVSEVPFYSPNAYPQANFNSGLVVGLLASTLIPFIQVAPLDVKRAAVGHTGACKEEMIEWAMNKYPTAAWKTYKRGSKTLVSGSNEHLADAIAAVHAGLNTDQFRQALAMYRSMDTTSLVAA